MGSGMGSRAPDNRALGSDLRAAGGRCRDRVGKLRGTWRQNRAVPRREARELRRAALALPGSRRQGCGDAVAGYHASAWGCRRSLREPHKAKAGHPLAGSRIYALLPPSHHGHHTDLLAENSGGPSIRFFPQAARVSCPASLTPEKIYCAQGAKRSSPAPVLDLVEISTRSLRSPAPP